MQNPEINKLIRQPEPPSNRALDIRRDNDTFVAPSITIYDIDYAIYFHLTENIQPQIEQNGTVINVPVIFANGEKWAQIQRNGYLRDSDRKIMAPLISIKRVSMIEDERFMKLNIARKDKDNSLIYFPVTQKNNQYDQHRDNNKPSYEFYISTIPQHVQVTYELNVWAETTTHLNKIVEYIAPHDRLPWGDVFQFSTEVQDYSFDVTNNIGEDRIAKCTMTLVTDGMLQPEFVGKKSTVQKAFTIKRVVFTNEVSQDNIVVDYEPRLIRPSESRLIQRKLKDKL